MGKIIFNLDNGKHLFKAVSFAEKIGWTNFHAFCDSQGRCTIANENQTVSLNCVNEVCFQSRD
jgi:predicted lactoylglutathione lyase